MNSYANEAVCCVARSVADKFSKREGVLFPLKYFYSNFGEISPITDDTTITRCHGRREKRLVSFLWKFKGCGGVISGVGAA